MYMCNVMYMQGRREEEGVWRQRGERIKEVKKFRTGYINLIVVQTARAHHTSIQRAEELQVNTYNLGCC